MDFDSFISKYYDEFGPMCPFKKTDYVSDPKEVLLQFKPKIMEDIELLTKFFSIDIDYIHKHKDEFTEGEITKLKQLDLYWDIPKVNMSFTKEGIEEYYKLRLFEAIANFIVSNIRNKDKT